MKYFLMIFITILFFGCGGEKSALNDSAPKDGIGAIRKNEKRSVNIYIHGYNQEGEKQTDIYGKSESDDVLSNIAKTTGYATIENYSQDKDKDIIVMTDYYGSIHPDYYTAQDITDIKNAQKGIPRYAYIVAKYIKYIMRETKTDSINIISASMGTLVSRYMIEKNLENLSSDKKIKKWLSFEGVIKGNVAASKEKLVSILDFVKPQPSEVEQMHYEWVKKNLDDNSPYYNTIQIGFQSSTRDDLNKGAITAVLLLDGKNPANDGVQAVADTYFDNPDTHVLFHENHRSLTKNMAVWGFAATFLKSKKHVNIILTEATVNNLHEFQPGSVSNRAEIVFQSKVHSLKAQEKWGFENAIDERLLDSGYLKIFKYAQDGETKDLNQVVFNSYILDEEESLELKITPYELDMHPKYKVAENIEKSYDSLGDASVNIPVKNGVYKIEAGDWSAKVKVEVTD